MAKQPNWSQDELSLLEIEYPKLGKCSALQQLFPSRNLDAIVLKANRMGFRVLYNKREGRTNEEYLKLLENTNFVSLETYRGSTTPILHMCGICDHEWKARPQHILREGAKCPICSTNTTKEHSLIEVKKVLELAGMEQLSEYLGALKPIKLKHKYCGHIWDTVYSYIQQGSGCPICNCGFGYSYRGSNLPEKALIYLFKVITNTCTFLKIGVTVRPINIREKELRSRIPNLNSIELLNKYEDSGIRILKKEHKILKEFNRFTYDKFDGSTELLHIDNDLNKLKEIMNDDKNF